MPRVMLLYLNLHVVPMFEFDGTCLHGGASLIKVYSCMPRVS